jgi:branched-chain amino acid aminotransferase
MQATANVNGIITAASEAKISIFDRGFLYGDSIYEVVRTYNGVPFFYEEHFDRLENSARLAQMELSQTRLFLKEEIRRTVASANVQRGEEVFIRYTITRGDSVLDLDPSLAKKTSYVILVKPLVDWNPRFFQEGMWLAIPSIRRNSPLALDPNIKSGNYLNNVLAVGEVKKLGADDALLLSIEGKLSEASNSNVCFVQNGKVVSPPHEPGTNTGNLKGLTKRVVAEVCKRLAIPYSENALRPEDISAMDECFVSSATREIMPVCGIRFEHGSKKVFPSGGGDITKKLAAEYKIYVAEYTKAHAREAFF